MRERELSHVDPILAYLLHRGVYYTNQAVMFSSLGQDKPSDKIIIMVKLATGCLEAHRLMIEENNSGLAKVILLQELKRVNDEIDLRGGKIDSNDPLLYEQTSLASFISTL